MKKTEPKEMVNNSTTIKTQIWDGFNMLRKRTSLTQNEISKIITSFICLIVAEYAIKKATKKAIDQFEFFNSTKFDRENKTHNELLNKSILSYKCGYHNALIQSNITLKNVFLNSTENNIYDNLISYLEHYDSETKSILGILTPPGTGKNLDLKGSIDELNVRYFEDKSILFPFVEKIFNIILEDLTTDEIILFEDIVQDFIVSNNKYIQELNTPNDIIELCSEINLVNYGTTTREEIDVYDFSSNYGNFLFKTSDFLSQVFPNTKVNSFGQSLNEQSYAFSKIFSRIRNNCNITYGNTLINDKFLNKKFDLIIGLSPFGYRWNDFSEFIENDKTERFLQQTNRSAFRNDSQFLFLQHVNYHLNEKGFGTVLVSDIFLYHGGAGSYESLVRKMLFKDQDIVQAIIKLPSNVFSQTAISPYILVLNKNKPINIKGKIIFVDAAEIYSKPVKNEHKQNNKRIYLSSEDKQKIVNSLKYPNGITSKVLTSDELIYNLVKVQIYRQDKDGKYITKNQLLTEIRRLELSINKQESIIPVENGIIEPTYLKLVTPQYLCQCDTIKVVTDDAVYIQDLPTNTIRKNDFNLGVGNLNIKIRNSLKDDQSVKINVSLERLVEKTEEIIPFNSDENINEQNINNYLSEWLTEPYSILSKELVCKIEFNKFFTDKSKMEQRSSSDILAELAELEDTLRSFNE